MDDDIEEYEISEHSTEEREEDGIEYLFMGALGLVESTDTLTTKIPDKSECE
ncbi:MAG: hypothetical protein WAW59_04950 [Patescibacteria group bacterium]